MERAIELYPYTRQCSLLFFASKDGPTSKKERVPTDYKENSLNCRKDIGAAILGHVVIFVVQLVR